MSTAERQIAITGGDCRFELFAQLFDIGRSNTQPPMFKLEIVHPNFPSASSETVEVRINGIKAEDGSGYRWIIFGHMSWKGAPNWVRSWIGSGGYFEGFYDTRTRTGFLRAG